MSTRRDFLKGIGALTFAGALSSIPDLDKPLTDEWRLAFDKVFQDYTNNWIVYGMGALKYTSEYPFVQSLSPAEILAIPELKRSLGEY